VESEKLSYVTLYRKSDYLFGFLVMKVCPRCHERLVTLKNVGERENNLYVNVTHIVNMYRDITSSEID
jgi:hypothetical protein